MIFLNSKEVRNVIKKHQMKVASDLAKKVDTEMRTIDKSTPIPPKGVKK